jgi:hypothetical protein
VTPLSIRAELAAAYRSISAAYNRLPIEVQDRIEIGYDGLEAEVDASIIAGDRDRALAAIRAWRGYWLDRFEEGAR